MSITVKVTSDFICPWCQIGEKRLLNAIEALPNDIAVEIEWLPFELNPDMPVQGIDRKTYRTMKFGSWEQAQARDAQTVAAGAEDGVRFNYDKIHVTPNTFAAHRLAWLAGQEGKQPAVVLAILNAYFHEGRDIGNVELLGEIARDAGLSPDGVKAFLESDEGTDEVQALTRDARAQGIHGVPHFNIEGFGVSGAQSPEILRQVLAEAHARKAAAQTRAAE